MFNNTETKVSFYTNEPPVAYSSSSLMSPDRREFYLGHKSGSRRVVELTSEVVPQVTTDARFPIDMCCEHLENGTVKTRVYFSSKMINVAKVQESHDATVDDLVRHGNDCIKNHASNVLKAEAVKRLPRRKHLRLQEQYAWIPLSETGELLLSDDQYPVQKPIETNRKLQTKSWYVWLSIILETPGGARTAIFTSGGDTFFVLQNAYHIVIEKL